MRHEKELRWPCPDDRHPGGTRLYEDHCFPTHDGRARLWARPHVEPRELPDHEFPLVLTTGRIAAHWHTRTRTGKVASLNNKAREPWIEIHPDDAELIGVADGDAVRVSSRRGSVRVTARLTAIIRPGVVFMPFHWGDSYAAETAANYLVNPVIGRMSRQPEYKACAVIVEPVSPVTADASTVVEEDPTPTAPVLCG